MTDIKSIIQEKEIPFLVHFTNLKNLDSIFKHGLVPRDQLGRLESESEINDENRLDGHEDSISLSISFPTCQRFDKIRQTSEDQYCSLARSPKLLLEKNSAFCKYNAADSAISTQDINALKSPEALLSMFDELTTQRSREEQKLKPCDPTDVQAEVLVFGSIPKSYIVAVVFPDKASSDGYKGLIGACKSYVHNPNKGFYGTRTFYREY